MSNFAAELLKPCTIDIEDGFIYDGILVSKAESEDGVCAFTGTYTFQVIKRKEMKIETRDTFQVEGNCICGCIYEIHALQALEQVTIDGLTIYHLYDQETLVIDGIDKLIYDKNSPEVSAFDQTNLLNFPKLKPGVHTVQKSDESIEVVIKYYPIFM